MDPNGPKDIRVKLRSTPCSLWECARLDRNNIEFTRALLDGRYLAGDREVSDRMRNTVIPGLLMRESHALVEGLAEVTRASRGAV